MGKWIEMSGLELWSGTLCCVLGQDTLLSSECISPPRSKNAGELNAGGGGGGGGGVTP